MTDQLILLQADSLGAKSPKIHSLGEELVYLTSKDGINRIWKMKTDGSEREQLYQTGNYICCINYSPDGRYISFNEGNPDLDVYRMNVDGTRMVALTVNDFHDGGPGWTSDNRIVFTSLNNGKFEEAGIYMMDHDGLERTRLHPVDFRSYDPVFSNNGQHVLGQHVEEDGNVNIYRIDVESGEYLKLTQSDSADWYPSWSHDDQWIVYRNNRHGNWDLYKIRPDGTGLTRLTDKATEDRSPSFSPCGNYILYQSRKGKDGPYSIWVMKNDGTKKRRVTRDSFDNTQPSWSPDGSAIYYIANIEGTSQIMKILFNGSGRELITGKNF